MPFPLSEVSAEAWCTALSARDTYGVLREIESILAALGKARGLALSSRLAVLDTLYMAAEPFTATLYADYLAQMRGQATQEARLWNALCSYWRSVEQVQVSLVLELHESGQGAEGTLLINRALCALSAQAKLARLRYWAVDARIWRELGRLLALVESVYERIPAELMQTLARFFMREMASPQNLLPREIEIVDVLAQRYALHFVYLRQARPEAAWCFDLTAGKAPTRRFNPEQVTTHARFFGAGECYRAAGLDAQTVERDGLAALPELADYTPEEVARMLRHVEWLWSPTPPTRAQDRREVLSRINIMFDLDEIRRNVGIGGMDMLDMGTVNHRRLNTLNARQRKAAQLMENWVVYDESSGGFGAEVPVQERDWLCAGKLIGFKREGGEQWGVGVIRRVEMDQFRNGRVGIQILSEKPHTAQLRPLSASQFAAWDARRENSGGEYGQGLLLSIPQGREIGMLLLPHGAYQDAPFFECVRGTSSDLMAVTKQAVHTHEYDLLMIRLA